MATLDDVKNALGVTTTSKDTEISELIDAAKLDMKLSGINTTTEDALIKRAIIIYCQSQFVQDNAIAERFYNSFRMLETHLALSSEYREVVPDA